MVLQSMKTAVLPLPRLSKPDRILLVILSRALSRPRFCHLWQAKGCLIIITLSWKACRSCAPAGKNHLRLLRVLSARSSG